MNKILNGLIDFTDLHVKELFFNQIQAFFGIIWL